MTDPTTPDGADAPDSAPEGKGGRAGDDDPTRPEASSVAVAVTVTRTGGFAGLRRTWHAQPESADAPQWIALIDGCPWDDADPTRPIDPHGADRFLWHVDARCGEAAREAALADPEVQGPWRDLIDAVRSAQSGKPKTNRDR
jgi:hypothetical protein